MSNSFVKRDLSVILTVYEPQESVRGETDPARIVRDTIALNDLRMSCEIMLAGGFSLGMSTVRVYGVKETLMQELTTLLWWRPLLINRTSISVYSGVNLIYSGEINQAYADYSSMPDVSFVINATQIYFSKVEVVEPVSFPDSATIEDIARSIAAGMGKGLKNLDVTGSVQSPYYPGSPQTQLMKLIEDTGIVVDQNDDEVLIIMSRGSAFPEEYLLTAATGLIGYADVGKDGLTVRCLYTPGIRHNGRVRIDGGITIDGQQNKRADGVWRVAAISHYLDAWTPDGRWYSEMLLTALGEEFAVLPRGGA